MSTLKEQYIIDAVEKISTIDEEGLNRMSETYTLAQTTFFSYLLSSAIEFENDDVMELIAFYFTVLMEAASKQGIKIKTIDDEMIDGFQDEYTQTLDEYMETSDNDLISTLCNQPAMLDFVLDEILGADEEGNYLPEGMQTELFVVGVAMIALFNRAIIK